MAWRWIGWRGGIDGLPGRDRLAWPMDERMDSTLEGDSGNRLSPSRPASAHRQSAGGFFVLCPMGHIPLCPQLGTFRRPCEQLYTNSRHRLPRPPANLSPMGDIPPVFTIVNPWAHFCPCAPWRTNPRPRCHLRRGGLSRGDSVG